MLDALRDTLKRLPAMQRKSYLRGWKQVDDKWK
jgi:hypothetical protein